MKFYNKLLLILSLSTLFIGNLKSQTVSDSVLLSGIETSLIEVSRLNLIQDNDSLYTFLKRVDSLYPNQSVVNYEFSNYYLQKGDIKNSLKYILKADSLNPNNEHYKSRLVEIYYSLREFKKCADVCSEIIEISPYNEDYYNLAIQYYAALEDYNSALSVLDKFEEVFGYNKDLFIIRSDLLSRLALVDTSSFKERKIQYALDNYNKDKNNPQYAIYLSLIYREFGLNKSADKVINQFEKKNGLNGIIELHKASLFIGNGDYDNFYKYSISGIDEINSSIDDKINYLSDFVDTYYRISNDSVKIIYGDKLLDILKHARDINSKNLTISLLYSELLNNHSNDKIQYIDELKRIISFDKSNDFVFENIVFYYLDENHLDSAIYYADMALKKFPDKGIFYYPSIYKAILDNNYHKAIELSEVAVEYVNKLSNLHLVLLEILGESYYNVGRIDEAFEIFDNILKFDPDNIGVLNNYAYYLSQNDRDLNKAKSMSYKTVYAEPLNPVYLDTYAWVLYKLGEFEDAEIYIKKSIENVSGDEDIKIYYKHYSDILKAVGKIELSEEYRKKSEE